MEEYKTTIGENGRINIPSALRKKMNLIPGEEVLMMYDDYSVYMLSMKQAIKEAQATMKQYSQPSKADPSQESSAEDK